MDSKMLSIEEPLWFNGTLIEVKCESETGLCNDTKGKKCHDDVHYKRNIKEEPLCLEDSAMPYIDNTFDSDIDVAKKIIAINNGEDIKNQIEIKEEPLWLEMKCDGGNFSASDNNVHIVKQENASHVMAWRLSTISSRIHAEEASRDGNNISTCTRDASVQNQIKDGTDDEYSSTCELQGNKRDLPYSRQTDTTTHTEKNATLISDLKIHSSFGKRVHNCDVCGKCFSQPSALKRHHSVHEGKRMHSCDTCEKGFTCLSALMQHQLIHEGKRPYKCDICENSFTQQGSLRRHLLIHEGKRPYKCEVCMKSFTQTGHLKQHQLIHLGKRPYTCDICEKGFTQTGQLKQHQLIHEGKRPYKCDVCEKSFTQTGHLKQHQLIHEGKRPYNCDICDKSFTRTSELKRHQLTHENVRPYKCVVCEKGFTRTSNLKQHQLIHEGKKTCKYVCTNILMKQ